MHFHWQNLNDKPGGREGSGLRHGRAWWHFSDRGVIGWEWGLFTRRLGASFGFDTGDGDGLHFSIQTLIFTLHVHAHGGIFKRLALKVLPYEVMPEMKYTPGEAPVPTGKTWKWHKAREVSIRVFDWAIWWELWRDPMGGWSSRDPARWRSSNFHPLDFLFGRMEHSERDLSVVESVVPMPERSYPCTVRMFESTWKRPRWPFCHRRVRANIDVEKNPIPVPGKGENSWDCGEDGTRSLTTIAATPEEAIAAMVETCLNTRRRHGGSVNWKPAALVEQAEA